MIINLAKRAHDQTWKFDPEIRSLLDMDYYKILMAQFIWEKRRDVPVTFSLIVRTKGVRLAETISEMELRAQLDHVRSLRFTKSELIWLAGNTFQGVKGIFKPGFIAWLENFRLPEYTLETKDGQFELRFSAGWADVTMWEIYAMAAVAALRTKASLAKLSEFEIDIIYANAKAKLWSKIVKLREHPDLAIADFGTRRRHSFLWHDYVVSAMASQLGKSFVGTSNALIAMRQDLEAIGTNAHELPMVLATLAGDDDAALKRSQYQVLEEWAEVYDGSLKIILPDTFGTTQFLRDAPDWVADWTGMRQDSKNPFEAGEQYIQWLESRGRSAVDKRLIFSDGLDTDEIIALHQAFNGRIRDSYGWGTMLTNDFIGCNPQGTNGFDPISIVCKVTSADGRPAVKLSDNYTKATGLPSEVDRYRRAFGSDGMTNRPATV